MNRIKLAVVAFLAFVLDPIRSYMERHLVFYAYSGGPYTTQATSDQNPPINLLDVLGRHINTYNGVLSPTTAQSTYSFVGGAALWYYRSSDSATIASSPGYFTDGLQLGMKTGDVMICVAQSSYGTSPSMAMGVLVTSNSSAGFNMAIGGVIQSS